MTPTEMHAEVLAALMWGPKMTSQLVEVVDTSSEAVRRWLEALHASGVIRISGEDDRDGKGRRERIWELQPKPFALPDWNPRQQEHAAAGEGAPE